MRNQSKAKQNTATKKTTAKPTTAKPSTAKISLIFVLMSAPLYGGCWWLLVAVKAVVTGGVC